MAPDTVQSYVTALDRMVGDYQFTCPVIDFAQSLAKTNLNERFVLLLSNSNEFWFLKKQWGMGLKYFHPFHRRVCKLFALPDLLWKLMNDGNKHPGQRENQKKYKIQS